MLNPPELTADLETRSHPKPFNPKHWRMIIPLALFALFVAHWAALFYRIQPAVSLWFPPAGVAVVLILWLGPVGAILAALASIVMAPWWGGDGWMRWVGALDAVEPVLAWLLYRHYWRGSLDLSGLKNGIAFILSAPLVGSFVSATLGCTMLMLLGKMPWEVIDQSIPQWWLGNAIGIMTIAPPVLLLFSPYLYYGGWLPAYRNGDRHFSWSPLSPPQALRSLPWGQGISILIMATFVCTLAVWKANSGSLSFEQLRFLSFLPILWAATQFGAKGGALVASFCTLVTLFAYLAFYPHDFLHQNFPIDPQILYVHKLSLLVQSGVALLLGSAIAERAATQTLLATERIRMLEYEARASLNQRLLELNQSLSEANFRLETANRELMQSQARFRASVENMLDCFGIYTAIRDEAGQIIDFRVEYVNDAACQNNQLSREQQVGQRLTEVIPVIRSVGLFKEYCRVVETGKSEIQELITYEDRNGKPQMMRAFDVRLAKFGDGVVVTWREITDRKQAEQELYRHQQEFKALVENSPDIISRIDSELRHAYVNPAIEVATGLPVEFFIGKTHVDLGLSSEWQKMLQEIFVTAQGQVTEFEFPDPNGIIRSYQARMVPEFAADGSVESVLGMARDITSLKQAQIALQNSEARLRRLVDSNLIGMVFADFRGQILEANEAFLELMGYTRHELQEQQLNWQTLTPPEYAEIDQAAIAQLQSSGVCAPYEKEYIRKNGDRIPILLGIALLEESAHECACFVLDLRERKRIEAERAELLKREQAARQQAETASRLKDEFLAIVSHELRSPLNAMLGWSQLLRTRKLDEKTAERAIEAIERNAKAQNQLIEDLLDISRIIRGKIRLYLRPIHLSRVVEAALDTVRPMASNRQITLDIQVDATIMVSGDPDRLQQVVWNLLSNAVKFTPEGGRVTAFVSRFNHYAQIQITDTGKGISPEFLPYVFDRFRQADGTSSRHQGGLGLGLAIVRNLVELHGGSVQAYSEGENQGSTFTVELPVLKTEVQKGLEETDGNLAEIERTLDLPLTGLRILIVDDELDTRDFIIAALEQQGAEVVSAVSVAEALQLLQQEKPDLLLSDIGMPGEDGYALIQQVRSLPPESGGTIPAAAITAYAREEDRLQAIAAGFQMHVSKPIDPGRLLRVTAILAGRNV